MRKIADELLVGRGQVEDTLLALAADLLLVGQHFHQHRVGRGIQRTDHHVRVHRLLQGRVQHHILPARIELPRNHGLDHVAEFIRGAEQVRQRQLHHGLARHREAGLGGGIGVDDAQAGLAHQQHGVGDHVQPLVVGHIAQ